MMQRLVLVGAGHAHAQVLLRWVTEPLPRVELCLVSPTPKAPYSGMVPGWLAGRYQADEVALDVPSLCARAGVRWLQDELDSLDADGRQLRLRSGAVLAYDRLSLNIGSTLRPPAVSPAQVLALRPLARLFEQWPAFLQAWVAERGSRPVRVMAVGGGAAGFESLLAVLARLRALRPDRPVQGVLVSRSPTLLAGLSAPAVRAARRCLERAGAQLRLDTDWQPEMAREADLVLWATGAVAHAWQLDAQRRGGLAVGETGFIRVDPMLRSVSHPDVFAVGDCAQPEPPLPKAGVFAVRQGPVLDANLRASLAGGQGRAYEAQRRYLVLLATGDGLAIASRGRWGAEGRWVWHWKDWIDRGFLRRFSA